MAATHFRFNDSATLVLLLVSVLTLYCGIGLAIPLADAKPADSDYPWPKKNAYEALESRVSTPSGFRRIPIARDSFGAWLRGLPVRQERSFVWLYNGLPKINQFVHHAVLDIDVGNKDLQQCADAVIRLRAEYLRSKGCDSAIAFHFTSGDLAAWKQWQVGQRPVVRGNKVSWDNTGKIDDSYDNFRLYLNSVFRYAGTISLAKELASVKDPSKIEIGDVFIQGGSPGHAVLVVDVAANEAGESVFLLAQSYMPAQDIHILKNPGSDISPWYRTRSSGELITPEWTFQYQDLKRFRQPKYEGSEHQEL